ncbi:hypothetical protein TNCV_1288701 [Trichonephila clavipes]|nr:hypothetical protein TNCV_1288701 [Trichonephila clavipes]
MDAGDGATAPLPRMGEIEKTMKQNGTNPETFPGRTGREDVPRNSKRSIEAERRRGVGKNAGRQSGRLKSSKSKQ